MRSSPFASRAALGAVLSSFSYVSAQSSPDGRYIAGGGSPGAAAYTLVDDYAPADFLNKFNFYSSYDPTYGHVQYVNESVATQNNYAYATNRGTFMMKPDTTNMFPRNGPGRPSVRVISDNTYYHGLFIFDSTHIPWGCGTWPAYWLLGPNWPYNGEIDIIEGVNSITYNTMAIHTSPGCSIAGSGQTGTFTNSNCDSSLNDNAGCGSELRNQTALPNNYGPGHNSNGGGVYATEWTSNYIKHWWFPRGSVPASITSGNPDVSQFGVPAVNAQGDCNIDQHFNNMSIIINIDFCGAWAGQAYASGLYNCPQSSTATNPLDSCVDFVGNNPQNMTEAYFEINRIQVYQMAQAAATTSTYSTSLSSVTTGISSTNTIPRGMGATTSTISSSAYSGPLSSASRTASSTTSAVAGPATNGCPAADSTLYTTQNGRQYRIHCYQDSTGGGGNATQVTNWEGCSPVCDQIANCGAWTFTSGENGFGTCYFKRGTQSATFSGAGPNFVAGIFEGPGAVPSSSSSAQPGDSTRQDPTSTSAPFSSQVLPTPGSTVSDSPSPSSYPDAISAYSASCPANNGQTVVDNCGIQYILGCGNDTTLGGEPVYDLSSFRDCFQVCSSNSAAGTMGTCLSFTWAGVCYLHYGRPSGAQNDNFTPSSSDRVAAIQIAYYNGANTQPVPSSTSRACGATPIPTTTTTRTTTTSSSSSTLWAVSSSVLSSSPSPPVVVSTGVSTWSSNGAALSSTFEVTTVVPASSTASSIPWSSVVSTAVSTSISTWTLDGITHSSTAESTWEVTTSIPAYSTEELWESTTPWESTEIETTVSEWSSDGVTYSSTYEWTSVSTADATLTEIPVTSTSISTWTSEGATYSSTYPMSSTPSSSPAVMSASTIVQITVSTWTSAGVTYSSTYPVTTVSSASSSATASSSPAPPCPTTYEGVCGAGAPATRNCASSDEVNYTVSCGVGYYGTTITDSAVGRLRSNATYNKKRYDAPDFAACQAACDATTGCVAVNYIPPTNCTLFSAVAGSYPLPGAVAAAIVPPTYGESSSSVSGFTTTQTQTVASVTTNVQATSTAGLATVTVSNGGTVTIFPTTTIISTLPPGGTFTSVTGGTSPGSYYVYNTTSSSILTGGPSASICFTCGLTPTVCTEANCGLPTGGPVSPSGSGSVSVGPIVTPTSTGFGTCPRVVSGTGYVTVHTTYTYTTCGVDQVCPNPGYVIIGGGGSMISRPGQVVVTTTGNGGSPITYTQIPNGSVPTPTGGGGGGGASSSSDGGNGVTQTSNMVSTATSTIPSTALPTCPYANGASYIDYMGQEYIIHCNTLLTDTTLVTSTQARLVDCINSCDSYNMLNGSTSPQCAGVSYYAALDTENCLLKSGSTGVSMLNVHSARLVRRAVIPGGGGTGGASTVVFPSGSGPGTVFGTGIRTETTTPIPVTTVQGDSTAFSTFVTTAAGESTIIGTQTFVTGDRTIISSVVVPTYGGGGDGNSGGGGGGGSTVFATQNVISGGQTFITSVPVTTGGEDGSGGTGPGPTSYVPSTIYGVSTAYSTVISNGITYTSTYGVSTIISISYVPASTNTVTTTSISISISNQVTTAYSTAVSTATATATNYISGPTVTTNGETATFTQAGPTVSVSVSGGGGGGGDTVTVTNGNGGGGTGGVVTVTNAVTLTIITQPSSSSSSSFCRTYSTNYFDGRQPVKRTDGKSLFSPGGPHWIGEPQPGARPRL